MRARRQPETDKFGRTFAVLRAILASYTERLLVTCDGTSEYQLCSRTMKDRIGRPLFVAGVEIKKTYVSYHLMPLYMNVSLQKKISPALQRRMQGKSCFNFTEITPEQVSELTDLTRIGIEMFQHVKLPWEQK